MGKLRTTINNYDANEVISALQKSIRRGLEKDAMFWAMELLPKYRRWLWQRLMVIVNEDIGIASPFAIVLIDTQKRNWEEFYAEKRYGTCNMILANAILYMCRSKKTRIADHFHTVVTQERTQLGLSLEIPDWALDKHTYRGKSMGRSFEHWRAEGCKLDPPNSVPDPYEDRAHELWPTKKDPEWYGALPTDDETDEDRV